MSSSAKAFKYQGIETMPADAILSLRTRKAMILVVRRASKSTVMMPDAQVVVQTSSMFSQPKPGPRRADMTMKPNSRNRAATAPKPSSVEL